MRTVDLIQRKRDGDELSPEEILALINAYTHDEAPAYQMAAFLMAVYFSGMTDREVSALTSFLVESGVTVDLSPVAGVKVSKRSTGGVGAKTSLNAAPLAAAAAVAAPTTAPASGRDDLLRTLPAIGSVDAVRSRRSTPCACPVARRSGTAGCGKSARPVG